MSKHIQLHIPESCHENWDRMTSVEKGRYCSSCQKQVVDFTGMTDEQLLAFFKRSTGSVCGRFMQDQLGRRIEIPKKRIPWIKYFFQFALPAFLFSFKATAQGKVKVQTGITFMVPAPIKIKAGKEAAVPEYKNEKIIRGKVMDENDNGIPYASILLKGTTRVVAADSTGNFSLKYNGSEDSCVLISSCAGFQEVETVVNVNREEVSVIIPMISNNIFDEGIVVGIVMPEIEAFMVDIGDSDADTTNILDTVWNKIFSPGKLPKVYPNPVKSNATLTIEIGKHEKGTHSFRISAVNGQILLSKELWVDENSGVVKIHIPSLAAGAYVLEMINRQTGKRNTEKIIIK